MMTQVTRLLGLSYPLMMAISEDATRVVTRVE